MADRDELFDDEPAPPEPAADQPERPPAPGRGLSRRRFIFGASAAAAAGAVVGTGATAGVLSRGDSAPASGGGGAAGTAARSGEAIALGAPADKPVGEAVVKLEVNGRDRWLSVRANESLAEVLRDRLGLTGTKIGCDRSECSACTVVIEGVPYNSCSLLAIREDGAKILTIEGLEQGSKLSAVQQAFLDQMGLQCGFCTPGQIMQATALLARNPRPSEDEIRREMSGNLCKCAAYANILAAVQTAAKGAVS